jgi:hypothetical protein
MTINHQYEIGKPIIDKRIINFMMRKLVFWTPMKYGKHTYIMTFNNVFRTK